MMLAALVSDLQEFPGIEIVCTHDVRMPPIEGVAAIPIGEADNVWQAWEEIITNVDAVWPIAPESGGVLERLSKLVCQHGKVLLNSRPQAITLATSKLTTAQVLSTAGIDVIPTEKAAFWDGAGPAPWVAKPDDGAGCEDMKWFDDANKLRTWLDARGRRQTHVVQPYMAGATGSLSLLCRAGHASLMSCNRQLIEVLEGVFHYRGSQLNGLSKHWQRCEVVAQAVAQAIPDLAGYVGVDVLIQDDKIIVVEVNPRLTTSYVGLRRATGCNPARMVVEMFYNKNFSWPRINTRNVVEILLDE